MIQNVPKCVADFLYKKKDEFPKKKKTESDDSFNELFNEELRKVGVNEIQVFHRRDRG